MPVNADVPPIEILIVDEPDHDADRIGAKGARAAGVTAGIAHAVLSATGKRVRALPITADTLIG